MKKLIYLTLIVTSFIKLNAQSQNWWRTNGNTPASTDVFGTTNAMPINFVTNNVLKMVLDANGNLRLVNFAGTGTRLVTTDANGNLLALPQGTAGQFLSSNGTYINLPASATTWSISGNDILSTNSGNVKINSNFIFGSAGTLKNNAWAGTGNRFLQTDANGNVVTFANGTTGQYLDGTGAWLNLPSALSSFSTTGNKIYIAPSMSLGIGTANPQYPLDVVGDARIQNNLYVGGGIVITDNLQASQSVTTSAMRADSILLDATRGVYGTTNLNGDVNVAANRTLTTNGDIMANSKLTVQGNAKFNGTLTATQGIDLGNGSALKSYVSTTPGVGTILSLGSGLGFGNDPAPCTVGTTATWLNNGSNGFYSSQTVGGNTAWFTQYVNSTNGNSYIDASGGLTGGSATAELFLNQNCGSNTRINYSGGGSVFMGPYVFMKNNAEIGDAINGINTGVGLKLNMKQGSGLWINTIGTTPSGIDAIMVGNNSFRVLGDGKTSIGSTTPAEDLLHIGNNEFKIVVGGLPNAGTLGFGTGYIGFNASRQSSGSWATAGDGSHNGGGTVWGDVNGNMYFSTFASNGTGVQNLNDVNVADKTKLILQSGGPAIINTKGTALNADAFYIKDASSANTNFLVKNSGYTEINVYSPSAMPQAVGGSPRAFAIIDRTNNKDLFVVNANGKIYSREVEISLAVTFPDYVFAKDYKLKPLNDVEAYINKYKHLPNFEKGEYYEKNGVNVADILLKQQQTIEELMLYNIELEKKSLEVQKQNAEILKRLQALEEKK